MYLVHISPYWHKKCLFVHVFFMYYTQLSELKYYPKANCFHPRNQFEHNVSCVCLLLLLSSGVKAEAVPKTPLFICSVIPTQHSQHWKVGELWFFSYLSYDLLSVWLCLLGAHSLLIGRLCMLNVLHKAEVSLEASLKCRVFSAWGLAEDFHWNEYVAALNCGTFTDSYSATACLYLLKKTF